MATFDPDFVNSRFCPVFNHIRPLPLLIFMWLNKASDPNSSTERHYYLPVHQRLRAFSDDLLWGDGRTDVATLRFVLDGGQRKMMIDFIEWIASRCCCCCCMDGWCVPVTRVWVYLFNYATCVYTAAAAIATWTVETMMMMLLMMMMMMIVGQNPIRGDLILWRNLLWLSTTQNPHSMEESEAQ